MERTIWSWSWVAAGFVVATAWPVRVAAQPIPISVATDGTPGADHSLQPVMSATGRFVAFTSYAANLVSNDTNGVADVFLRDRDTDADGVFDEPGAVSTVRISERAGVQGNGASGYHEITPDGRYVVFASVASNLFSSGQPALAAPAILRWDRLTGDIVLVSQTSQGQPLLALGSITPALSDDGNQVVFQYGGGVTSEVQRGVRGVIYRRDIAAGTLTQVSTLPVADGAGYIQLNELPSISSDGATVVYAIVQRMPQAGAYWRVGGTVCVVDAATNAVRATYAGVEPHLSRGTPLLMFIGDIPGFRGGPFVRLHLPSGERRTTGFASAGAERASFSLSGRYFMVPSFSVDFHYASFLFLGSDDRVAFDGTDATFAYSSAPSSQPLQIFVRDVATWFDRDGDGLNDHWESVFGLDTQVVSGTAGNQGASGDPDADGLTNADEFARGSNPVGGVARYLAEGSAGTFFTTRVAIANPTDIQANVAVRFELAGGGTVKRALWVPPRSRVSFDSRAQGFGTASFSTVVESTQPVAVDRLMTWGDAGGVPYGSHAESAGAAPGTSWFLAEGSTSLGFQLFYLLQNPQQTATAATVRYLLPSGAPVVRSYDLPPQSRTTIYANTVPGLEATDVSAAITATQPIAVERAMYRSSASQAFALGHDAAAVAAPATSWLFAEGATGAFFDTYLLLANPSSTPATVQVDYLRDAGGAVSRTYTVAANARFSVFVDDEPGMAATSFGIRVASNVPVVAERAMYWAGGFFDYYEGHASVGASATGSRWVLAEGEQGGAGNAQMFVLIANTGAAPASVVVRTLSDGVEPPVATGVITIAGNARVTVPMASLPGYTRGSIEVIEQGTTTGALIIEGALYSDAGGVPFAAGANWPGTRISP